jgi:AraC-like DNA-binding protein
MHLPALTRRHVSVHSVGNLEIIERGLVVTDAEFAARAAGPANVVACHVVVRDETLGVVAAAPTRVLTVCLPREWVERAAGPCAEIESGNHGQPEALVIGDLALIRTTQIARAVGAKGETRAPVWIREVCRRIAQDVCNASLPVLARAAGVHPVHLSRTFRRFVGTTVTQARHTLRLQRAVEEVIRSNRTIAQIASDHGFADHGHFTRALVKATGRTPRYLRNKARPPRARR